MFLEVSQPFDWMRFLQLRVPWKEWGYTLRRTLQGFHGAPMPLSCVATEKPRRFLLYF